MRALNKCLTGYISSRYKNLCRRDKCRYDSHDTSGQRENCSVRHADRGPRSLHAFIKSARGEGGRWKRGTKRNDHRPAFRRKIDGHYSPVRSNSFPIFRGANEGRMGKGGGGRKGGRGREIGVCRFGIICWFVVDRPIFLRYIPILSPPSSTLSTMFLMNNHADILMFDVYSRVISSESLISPVTNYGD